MTRLITFPYRYCPVVGFGCWYLVADGCTVCRFCAREIAAADLDKALGKAHAVHVVAQAVS